MDANRDSLECLNKLAAITAWQVILNAVSFITILIILQRLLAHFM